MTSGCKEGDGGTSQTNGPSEYLESSTGALPPAYSERMTVNSDEDVAPCDSDAGQELASSKQHKHVSRNAPHLGHVDCLQSQVDWGPTLSIFPMARKHANMTLLRTLMDMLSPSALRTICSEVASTKGFTKATGNPCSAAASSVDSLLFNFGIK